MTLFGNRLSLRKLKAMVGREVGLSDWFTVSQERIDAFAAATKDRQWIHVDPERAARSPLGGTVAHGFLLPSLVPFFNSRNEVFTGHFRMAVNYGLDRVRFPALRPDRLARPQPGRPEEDREAGLPQGPGHGREYDGDRGHRQAGHGRRRPRSDLSVTPREGSMDINGDPIEKPEEINFILGQSHFIKTVEDLHEAIVTTAPHMKFGIAFCESSGPALVRARATTRRSSSWPAQRPGASAPATASSSS